MTATTMENLSRRERQIMDIIYKLGQATAVEVMENLPDPPSYSAVRAMLRILEDKHVVKHKQDGPRYVFQPVVSRERALRSAIKNLMQTFFDGSAASAVAALIDVTRTELSEAELERLSRLIRQAQQEGK